MIFFFIFNHGGWSLLIWTSSMNKALVFLPLTTWPLKDYISFKRKLRNIIYINTNWTTDNFPLENIFFSIVAFILVLNYCLNFKWDQSLLPSFHRAHITLTDNRKIHSPVIFCFCCRISIWFSGAQIGRGQEMCHNINTLMILTWKGFFQVTLSF